MPDPSDGGEDWSALRDKIIGLGEASIRKSYYPVLKRRIEELDESQRFLSTLMNNLPGMVYRYRDPGHWVIDFVSEGCALLTGYPPAELLGSRAFDRLIHPEDRAAVMATIDQALGSRSPFQVVYRLLTAEGGVKWAWEQGRGIYGQAGQLLALEGFVTDISPLRHAKDQLAKRTLELQQAKELDHLKASFVNAISHDLRTPLTAIVGYTEFLEDEVGGPLGAVQRNFVAQIEASCHRMERLVDDLLDFARLEAGSFSLRLQSTDLGELVKSVVAAVSPRARESGIELVEQVAPLGTALRVDAARIERVFFNLINNALAFTPHGGTVAIRVRQEADRILCEVQDSGIGIDARGVSHLFLPFSQLDPQTSKSGAGLGLSIAKSIIEAHGGQIGVHSEPGSGSTFWFSLPLGK